MDTNNFRYFQFQKDLNIPVFIKVDTTQFEPSLVVFLESNMFSELTDDGQKKMDEMVACDQNAKVLYISEASPLVARQIDSVIESDQFGEESITPKNGYRVYRYKHHALMIYSFGASEWQLGVFPEFGAEEFKLAHRSVINRFISWAVAPLGIIGMWGVPVDDGMVILRQAAAIGEAVFLDVINRKLISVDSVRGLRSDFKIMKLDPLLKGRNVRMSSEELFSVVSTHCTYFDYEGLSVPVRQIIQAISKMGCGLVHPEESFRPRTDLSV